MGANLIYFILFICILALVNFQPLVILTLLGINVIAQIQELDLSQFLEEAENQGAPYSSEIFSARRHTRAIFRW